MLFYPKLVNGFFTSRVPPRLTEKPMQLKKLAFICNTCFWLTLIFQFWKNAREIQPHILGTIITLGILAVILNVCWIVLYLVAGKTRKKAFDREEISAKTNSNNATSPLWFNGFNLLSFIAQLILLSIKFL